MGIAVFYGPELRDWYVKNMEGRWSTKKMEKTRMILSNLMGRHGPNVLAIKQIHPSRTSPNLNRLVSAMKEMAKKSGLRVCEYSIQDLEKFFYPEERINKRELAEIVASEYPVLFHELNREKGHRNPYHTRMFEAVALASVCFHQLKR